MRTVTKLYAILSMFHVEKPEWRQSDLARALEVSQSTLSRNLASMTELGFLRYKKEAGTYALGPTIISLAGTAINHYDEFRNSYSEMHGLMNRTQLGANLAVLDGGSVMNLMHIDGPKMQRSTTLIGRHLPLHATALGKVFLASFDESRVRALAENDSFIKFTAHTNSTLEAVLEDLAAVRRRGYSTENEELGLGNASIAAPIRGRDGTVVAALCLSGPKEAIGLPESEEGLAGLLLNVTDRISGKFGYVVGVTRAGADARAVGGADSVGSVEALW